MDNRATIRAMKISALHRVLLVALLMTIVCSVGSELPAAATEEQVAGAPVERVLPSGARALLWPRPGSGTVLVTVAVRAGSQDEPANMGGLSHYLEHLLFDGFDDLDERGVTEAFERLSAYMNAFTREQTTVYFALAPRREAVATAELIAGMLTRSEIVPTTFEKEKKVILEELAKDHASPDGLREERLRSLLWAGTPLQHPVGGSEESVGATTRAEVVRYWQRHYGASGYRILITGDLPVAELEEVLAPFAELDASGPQPKREDSLSWAGWGEWAAAEAPKTDSAQSGMPPAGMGMGHGGPGGGGSPDREVLALIVAAPDALAKDGTSLELLARWLGGSAGPLSSELVPKVATEVTVGRLPFEPRDLLEIRVKAASRVGPEELLARVLGVLDFAASGPTDGEVFDVQRAWTGERALNDQRLHYAAVFYGDALAAARGSLADSVDPPDVSPDRVRAAAGALLGDTEGRIRAAWLGAGGPQDRQVLPAAVAPTAREAVSALAPGPLGGLTTTLSNGMVVGILPETGSAVFGVHLLVADRTLHEPADAPGVADFMHRLLPGGSVLGGSRELASRIERLGIEVKAADSPMIPFDNRYHVPDFSYVRLEGPTSSLAPAIELLAEMVRMPGWDDEGWRNAVDGLQAARKADNRGGERARQVFFATLLGPDHPLAQPVSGPLEATIPEKRRVEDIWGTWPGGFFAPNRLVLTVASPLPANQTLEIIEDAFSGGPDSNPRRGPYPNPQPASSAQPLDVGDAPQVTVLWGRIAEVAAEDRAALLVAMDALSDRMVAVIREQEGLAYRLGAGVRLVPGGDWILSASVGTRPENRDRVAELLEELVGDLAGEPISTEDVARLNARQRRTRMLRGLSAASRAYRLGRALFEGSGSPLAVDEDVYAKVTPEEVQAAAQRYLVPDKMLLVVTP
jgi:predicted Zn-dependent peptidase